MSLILCSTREQASFGQLDPRSRIKISRLAILSSSPSTIARNASFARQAIQQSKQHTPCRPFDLELTYFSCSSCVEGTKLHLFGTRPDGSCSAKLKRTGESVRSYFFGQSSFMKTNCVAETCVVKYPYPPEDAAVCAAMGCGYQTGINHLSIGCDLSRLHLQAPVPL